MLQLMDGVRVAVTERGAVRLGAMQWKFLKALVDSQGTPIPYASLYEIWGKHPPTDKPGVLKNNINFVRRKLATIGIPPEAFSYFGVWPDRSICFDPNAPRKIAKKRLGATGVSGVYYTRNGRFECHTPKPRTYIGTYRTLAEAAAAREQYLAHTPSPIADAVGTPHRPSPSVGGVIPTDLGRSSLLPNFGAVSRESGGADFLERDLNQDTNNHKPSIFCSSPEAIA